MKTLPTLFSLDDVRNGIHFVVVSVQDGGSLAELSFSNIAVVSPHKDTKLSNSVLS